MRHTLNSKVNFGRPSSAEADFASFLSYSKPNTGYDSHDRLASMTSTDSCNTAYSYNLNSSPLTVMRRGLTSAGTVGVVDDLTMSYNGNLLSQVVNAADAAISGSSPDYMQEGRPVFGPQSYSYDSSGRLKSDPSRGITSVTYHENDRPALITTRQNGTRSYEYDNDGNKLSVRTASANSGFPGSGGSTLFTRHAYCGSSEYDYTLINKRRNTTLTRINLPWGYLDGDGKEYRYIADYQGNVRAVTDALGHISQATDYYPYGLTMATSTGAEVNPYKYAGTRSVSKPFERSRENEFETGLGLNFHDFEARMLFNDRTLFNRPDPQAYVYCAGNPIRYVDSSGENYYTVDIDGNFVLTKTTDDNFDRNTSTMGDNPYIDVDKSFMESMQEIQGVSLKNSDGITTGITMNIFNGSSVTSDLHEFLAKNTYVEWTASEMKTSEGETKRFIGTSHIDGSDGSIDKMFEIAINNGFDFISATHNHTNDSSTVSDGDIRTAKKIQAVYPNAKFYIILRNSSESPRLYDKNSTAGVLQEVTCYGIRK